MKDKRYFKHKTAFSGNCAYVVITKHAPYFINKDGTIKPGIGLTGLQHALNFVRMGAWVECGRPRSLRSTGLNISEG